MDIRWMKDKQFLLILLVYLSRHRVLNILKREEKIRTDSEDDEGDFHEDTYSIVGKSEAEEDERNNSAEKRDPLFSDFKRLLTWTQLSLSALRAHQTFHQPSSDTSHSQRYQRTFSLYFSSYVMQKN